MVCHVVDQIRFGDEKEISMAELRLLGLPIWVAVPVFKTLDPSELIVS